jgi:hypothetical protein
MCQNLVSFEKGDWKSVNFQLVFLKRYSNIFSSSFFFELFSSQNSNSSRSISKNIQAVNEGSISLAARIYIMLQVQLAEHNVLLCPTNSVSIMVSNNDICTCWDYWGADHFSLLSWRYTTSGRGKLHRFIQASATLTWHPSLPSSTLDFHHPFFHYWSSFYCWLCQLDLLPPN